MKEFAVLLLMTLPLLACDNDGPFERAAEEIDEAVEDIGAGGETTGNRIDDAVDDVADGLEDAADELDGNR